MKTYAAMYEQSKKEKNIKQLTAIYRKWIKSGDTILGRFIGKSTVTSSLGGGEYNQYLFDTDDGLVKFSLGRSGDSEIGAVMKIEHFYVIEFKGQEDLTSGRRVNKFECSEIGFSDDSIETSVKAK